MIPPPVTGIILAGGESRRMGALKPLIPYKDKPLIQWVFNAMSPLVAEIIIIANAGDFSFLNARVYPDNYPGNGPAAGFEAGLSHCTTPLALFSSCDTPNLTTAAFAHLIENHGNYDISIAAHDGTNEPLIGLFSKNLHAAFLEAILRGDPHPPRIMKKFRWQEVEFHPGLNFWRPDLFLNLNSPSDLKIQKMANVNLIYFGSVTDITGIPREKAEVPDTLNDLNKWLLSRFPGLTGIRYRFSVNRQLVTGDHKLADGDEIALLPPFAGG